MSTLETAHTTRVRNSVATTEAVAKYWNEHIHDLSIATHPVGTPEFFAELDEYRFGKLEYLPKVVDFEQYQGKKLLEVGCGVGIDLVHFARAGADVTGIDLAPVSIELAQKNFVQRKLPATFSVMDGEQMTFPENHFDVVYAHGVLQYAANPQQMLHEIYRVLRPGGEAILMVYNRHSWLSVMSMITSVALEHGDAPAFRTFSMTAFRQMLNDFAEVRMFTERLPVRTRLHNGLKAKLYNEVFVSAFHLLPRSLLDRIGWHIMVFAYKK